MNLKILSKYNKMLNQRNQFLINKLANSMQTFLLGWWLQKLFINPHSYEWLLFDISEKKEIVNILNLNGNIQLLEDVIMYKFTVNFRASACRLFFKKKKLYWQTRKNEWIIFIYISVGTYNCTLLLITIYKQMYRTGAYVSAVQRSENKTWSHNQ